MKKYFTTDGRFTRMQFWKFVAVMFLYLVILGGIGNAFESETMKAIIGFLVLPMLLVLLIVQIKRWHDLNQSGWLILINIVPLIGGFISLIILGFLKGTNGENDYGPDPLAKPEDTPEQPNSTSP